MAHRAERVARQVHGGRDSFDGIAERQVELGLEVDPALWTGAATHAAAAPPTGRAAAVEQTAEEVAQVDVFRVEVEAAGASGPTGEATDRSELADVVVLLALGLVADHVVGGGDLLEALFGL